MLPETLVAMRHTGHLVMFSNSSEAAQAVPIPRGQGPPVTTTPRVVGERVKRSVHSFLSAFFTPFITSQSHSAVTR